MRKTLVAAVVAAAALVGPAAAHAAPGFSGSCHFSGPITPMPPITLLPRFGAHFSYRGTGSCSTGQPITVRFNNVATLFDTCELGPDFNLHGAMTIGTRSFRITVNLARLAVAGPFLLNAAGGGQALGLARFTTSSPQQCVSTGVASASLSAVFHTLSPLR